MAGKEGPVVREGQAKVSNACGAIEAILGEIHSGVQQDGAIRDDNVEYDTLKKRVFFKVAPYKLCTFTWLHVNFSSHSEDTDLLLMSA